MTRHDCGFNDRREFLSIMHDGHCPAAQHETRTYEQWIADGFGGFECTVKISDGGAGSLSNV